MHCVAVATLLRVAHKAAATVQKQVYSAGCAGWPGCVLSPASRHQLRRDMLIAISCLRFRVRGGGLVTGDQCVWPQVLARELAAL